MSLLNFTGGTIVKNGPVYVANLSWTNGILSGTDSLYLTSRANITAPTSATINGGSYVNNGETDFYTNPNVTTGQTCLTITSPATFVNNGTLNITSNCIFSGNGAFSLYNGSIYVGNNDSFSTDVNYLTNATTTYTSVLYTLYLNGNTHLNGTLIVNANGKRFSNGDTINLFIGSNITGSFSQLTFKPQPLSKGGDPIKYTVTNVGNKYQITFNSSYKITFTFLALLLAILFI